MAIDSTFASHPPCPIRGSFAFPGTVAVPEMGLGSSDSKTELAEAREARDEARRLLRFRRNPIDVRKQDRRLSAKIQGMAQCETPRSMALEPHDGCGGPKVPAG
jgi:hypothetical protein